MKLTIKYKHILMCIVLLMLSLQGFSQHAAMDWTAESLLVNINGTDVEIESSLTKQGTAIVWEQQNSGASQRSTFNLISVSGTWNTQNNTGSINYELDHQNIPVTLNVTGTSDGITVTLTYYRDNSSTDELIFQIDNLDQL